MTMYASAAHACQIQASCMVARVWSKLGKSRMSPLQLTTMDAATTKPQNHTFSIPLKRPDGTCSPRRKKAGIFTIQRQSYERHRLSFAHITTMTSTETMKNGATKLCRFLHSAVSQANSV